jgi:hypothetical protein
VREILYLVFFYWYTIDFANAFAVAGDVWG